MARHVGYSSHRSVSLGYEMPKIFTMFSSFSMASLALPGMSGFVAELVVFFGLITSPKFMLMPKMRPFYPPSIEQA